MHLKRILPVLLVLTVATPALAAEYYIVRDTATKKCAVVTEKPAVETTVIVDEAGAMFATQTEAEEAMKKVTICTSQ